MKKSICILLAIVLITVIGLSVTACSGTTKTAETIGVTQIPTEKPTLWQPKDKVTTPTPQKSTDDAQNPDATKAADSDSSAELTQDEALDKALAQYPGCYSNGIYQGTDPQGNPAWVVLMITADYDDFTVYVTKDKVYTDSDAQNAPGSSEDSDYYAGMTEGEALSMAIGDVGAEFSANEVYKGVNPEGAASWIVHTGGPNGESYVSYVNEDGVSTYPA